MKLIQISDIHVHDQEILGTDPVPNFRACLEHVATHHGDADLLVITGDLTHHGAEASYARLAGMLADGPLPEHLRPRLLIGNHDDRANFQAAFPDTPRDPNGFVQYAEDTEAGRFLYLDTNQPGTHAGQFCDDRQAWLRAELDRARADGVGVFLFLHHHPCPVGAQSADVIGIAEGAALRTILKANRDIVRHVFFGHCHFPLAGSVAGIPMSAPRSTCHPCAADLGDQLAIGVGGLAPNYHVVLIDEDNVVVHTEDFLVDVKWLVLQDDGWLEDDRKTA